MTRTGSVRGDAGEGDAWNRRRDGASRVGGGDGSPVGYLRSVPDLASPIRRRSTSFSHVALAYLFGREGLGPAGDPIPQGEKRLCRDLFPGLLQAYEEQHGHICRSFFGQAAFVAAAITDNDELEIVWSREESIQSPAEVRLLSRCDQLSYAAHHRLHRFDRRHCQQMIFSVVLELLRRIDRQQPEPPGPAGSHNGADPGPAAGGGETTHVEDGSGRGPLQLTELSERLNEAEDFMLRSATRRAHSHYLKGMLGGTAAVLVGIGALAWLLWTVGLTGTENADVVLALSAGALGALVSVLMRMTLGEFNMNLPTLDAEMQETDVHLVAAARPLIGAVSGVIAYALVRSSLVPLDPASGDDPTFLWMGVAFLAGFSERLAQDMFARSGRGLDAPIEEVPISGPSAGLSLLPGQVSPQRGGAVSRRGRKPAPA
jgi:hypothetical protein